MQCCKALCKGPQAPNKAQLNLNLQLQIILRSSIIKLHPVAITAANNGRSPLLKQAVIIICCTKNSAQHCFSSRYNALIIGAQHQYKASAAA